MTTDIVHRCRNIYTYDKEGIEKKTEEGKKDRGWQNVDRH